MLQRHIDSAAATPVEHSTNGDVLFDLGIMFSIGSNCTVDLIAAHKWFNMAAFKGRADAIALRREIAEQMSCLEIAIAHREARAWMTLH